MTLGQALKQARINAGLTQSDVAKAIGVGNQFISNCERDICSPPKDKLKRYRKALKLQKREFKQILIQIYESNIEKLL